MIIVEIDTSDYCVYKNRKLIKTIDKDFADELWDIARALCDPDPHNFNSIWFRNGSSINSEFQLSDAAIYDFINRIEN